MALAGDVRDRPCDWAVGHFNEIRRSRRNSKVRAMKSRRIRTSFVRLA